MLWNYRIVTISKWKYRIVTVSKWKQIYEPNILFKCVKQLAGHLENILSLNINLKQIINLCVKISPKP